MHQHLNMLLTLRELANHAGQSQSHYSRVFKEKTGQSPLNYFIQLKISKACELLSDTDMKINEIAVELGYEDPYYFSRIFKKLQGVAPAVYRDSLGSTGKIV
jgi:AraC-like DNA-binding protein